MKLEREPVFGQKPDPKSFDYDELSLKSSGLKSGRVMKDFRNGHSHDSKQNGCRFYLMNDGSGVAASELDCFMKNENIKSFNEYRAEDFLPPFAKCSEIKSLENESDFYTNKCSMECEMPELQVFYRDCSYSSVKDICVDEGLHSQDKLFRRSEKSSCTFVFSHQDLDKELDKEVNIDIFSLKDSKSCAENELSMDFICESKGVTPTGEENCDAKDKFGNDISQDVLSLENVILTKETEADNSKSRSPAWEENEMPEILISSDSASETSQTVSTGSGMSKEKLDNNCEEALVATAFDSGAEEPEYKTAANPLSYSSKFEKRRMTSNFDSLTTVSMAEEGPQKGISECSETKNISHDSDEATGSSTAQTGILECDETRNVVESRTCDTQIVLEKTRDESEIEECSQTGVSGSVESPKTSSVDDEASEGQNASGQPKHAMATEDGPQSEDGLSGSQFVSSHFQFGESSFSAAGPLSGHINYSGPVPYSGSISVRSDSSTTSTRSFAFPILQNEWNSSPVRMAKADRRHFRKHRGWKQGILCCRF